MTSEMMMMMMMMMMIKTSIFSKSTYCNNHSYSFLCYNHQYFDYYYSCHYHYHSPCIAIAACTVPTACMAL